MRCIQGSLVLKTILFADASEIRNKTVRTTNATETITLTCGSKNWLYKPESNSESHEFIGDEERQTLELMSERHVPKGVVTVLTMHNLVPSDSGIYSCLLATYIQQYLLDVRESSGNYYYSQ